MEPLRRVHRLWNWLPAFRAVAETEHLPTASEMLGVSPSALSRSIKLIEDDLGRDLFEREGRNLRLNESGRAFLEAVRDAMRRVHDGIGAVDETSIWGAVRVGAAGLLHAVHLPGLVASLRRNHPGVVARVITVDVDAETGLLLTGQVDVAFSSWGQRHEATELVRLGEAISSVWCGPGHPLYEAESPTEAELLAHAFVSPVPDTHGRTGEGWPADRPREIGAQVQTMQLGLDLCASGDLLAVLPDDLARRNPALRRFPVDFLPRSPLFARKRKQIGPPGKAELIIDEMRRVLADAAAASTDSQASVRAS